MSEFDSRGREILSKMQEDANKANNRCRECKQWFHDEDYDHKTSRCHDCEEAYQESQMVVPEGLRRHHRA